MGIIGPANEFWRLRIVKVDTADEFDFDWHPDILFREPPEKAAVETELFFVEAVSMDDSNRVERLGSFSDKAEAEECLADTNDDLICMTRSQFEEAHF